MSKLGPKNLSRISGLAPLGSMVGRHHVKGRNGVPSISTSVDLTQRVNRYNSVQTPQYQHSAVDKSNNYLEQILSKQEASVSKSLIVDEGRFNPSKKQFASIEPRSVRNMAKGAMSYNTRKGIDDINLSIIPPPTTLQHTEILNKRARKFSAKMSTNRGSRSRDPDSPKFNTKLSQSKGGQIRIRNNRRSTTQTTND